ncbi:MAG: BBP7 family outer membrane beta-barrel protein [Thermoguttaceae bacterium]
MRISFLLSLVFWVSAAAAWSQDVPPPLPTPAVAPALPSPSSDSQPGTAAPAAPSQPAPAPYYPPPGSYAPPPGAVMVVPGQPYPYAYPPPGPYGGPIVMSPRVAVLVPAPPLPSYEWSATVEALFLERSSGGSTPLGYTYYNSASQLPANLGTDSLYSDDATFPLEAGLRLEISRKFDNDITLAATYWGLQQWSVNNTIYGDPYQETVLAYSPYLQLPTLLHGLDDSLGYMYASQVQNVEVDALFRLNPSDPYWEVDWLWGARYVYFSDHLTLTGVDDLNSASEQLDYKTTNNLVGAQTGLLFVHGWSRVQWEAGLKVGLMANIYHQSGSDTASGSSGIPAGFTPYNISNNGSGLSGLFELSFAACYRLTDNLGLRLGYQVYDITGLALAPRQLGSFGHGGNVAFDGLSIGLHATW